MFYVSYQKKKILYLKENFKFKVKKCALLLFKTKN